MPLVVRHTLYVNSYSLPGVLYPLFNKVGSVRSRIKFKARYHSASKARRGCHWYFYRAIVLNQQCPINFFAHTYSNADSRLMPSFVYIAKTLLRLTIVDSNSDGVCPLLRVLDAPGNIEPDWRIDSYSIAHSQSVVCS